MSHNRPNSSSLGSIGSSDYKSACIDLEHRCHCGFLLTVHTSMTRHNPCRCSSLILNVGNINVVILCGLIMNYLRDRLN